MSTPLKFKKGSEEVKTFRPPTNKIGWINTLSDKEGAKFDIVIRDVRGHTIAEKRRCGNDTNRYGELINVPVMMGQEVEVAIENIEGAEEVDLFIN